MLVLPCVSEVLLIVTLLQGVGAYLLKKLSCMQAYFD